MSILIDKKTGVVVQGITGHQGSFHTKSMLDYGTNIVAGVTPGKGGQDFDGIPIYNSINEIKENVNSSIIFVPAKFTSSAVNEALNVGLNPIVVITEGVPIHDSLKFVNLARKDNIAIIGPNTPGVISPGKCKLGIMPSHIFSEGPVGIISRSGTLTYEIVSELTKFGIGQSTAIGLGGDPIVGLDYTDMLKMFEKDNDTEAVIVIGEIGGNAEERMAEYVIKNEYCKPVVAYIAGRTAPSGKRMGHAGAIIYGNSGTYESKVRALESAGVHIARTPHDIVEKIYPLIKNRN